MDSTILYYNNETNQIYYDEYGNLESEYKNGNDIMILALYLLGFYHLSWYIINKSSEFLYDGLMTRLDNCIEILTLLNEQYDIFEDKSIRQLDTEALLKQALEHFNDEITDSEEDIEDSEELEEELEEESEEEVEYDVSYECEYDCGFEDKEREVVENHEVTCRNKYTYEELEIAEAMVSRGNNWEYTL